VFAAMLYVATRRSAYLIGAFLLLAIGSAFAHAAFGHVRVRVDTWLDPWTDPQDTGFQIIQSWYAFGSGGIGGTGLGLGSPWQIPHAATDFIFSAIGEELGLVGTLGVLTAFMLLMGSAYRIAVDAPRPFEQLFAAGLATIIGLQAFLIIGGVTRVIPLTGITLPFVSYGGSSLVANFALLALLLRISNDSARERADSGSQR
jgi:cell division protein FtsW (lipid II flippase)